MKKLALFLMLILIFGGFLFFRGGVAEKMFFRLPEVREEITGLIQEIEKQVMAPEPLIATKDSPRSFLTQAGVVQQTNARREEHGLPALQESPGLNKTALMKAQDMLSGQYFEHISPSGEGVGDLAKVVGYEFIAIGENLALGNFEDDQALVQGWMDSPGHRANILNIHYREIGVAVLQGDFEGKRTWVAVQHFALPLSACPKPSEELEAEIVKNQKQIENLQEVLAALRQEIEGMRPKKGSVYSQKIEQYNELVSQHNNLLFATQDLINQHNNQVLLFNECAALN